MGSGILESGGVYDPPAYPLPRDFFPDYIVTVVAPLLLAVILFLLLTYIMCCRREGVYVFAVPLNPGSHYRAGPSRTEPGWAGWFASIHHRC